MLLSTESLIQSLEWRYATKHFDPSKQIPSATWKSLEKSLQLTPSSYGLQPWRFLVVTDPALKGSLRTASWDQAQIEECSHLVVFAAKEKITGSDVDHFIARIADVRGTTPESLTQYRAFMMGDLVNGPRAAWVDQWAARQTYIALGQFLAACALLGIDTCPIEGLDPTQYDAMLGLTNSGYRTVCACPAGYRAANDTYASLPKVRFPVEEIILHP